MLKTTLGQRDFVLFDNRFGLFVLFGLTRSAELFRCLQSEYIHNKSVKTQFQSAYDILTEMFCELSCVNVYFRCRSVFHNQSETNSLISRRFDENVQIWKVVINTVR